MIRTILLLAAFALLLAPAAFAQPPSVPLVAYGKMGKLPMMSFCMDGAMYKLENSNLRMKDNPKGGVDASKFVGQWVRVEGTFTVGLMKYCELATLTRITASTEYLEEKGSTLKPGGMINFTFYGTTGSFHVLLMAMGQPIRPIIPLGGLGILALPLTSPFFNLIMAPIGATGTVPFKMPIPNDPVLSGIDLTFQSAAARLSPTQTAYLLNPWPVKLQ